MSVTLNVYVKDRATGLGIGNARVLGLTKNQIIDPPVRQTSGDGGANLYYEGPPFSPPITVTLAVDAPGYAPGSTNDKPILLGSESINYVIELDSFKKPFVAAPRTYKGNMCGTFLTGLPPIPGGAANPELVITWLVFYHTLENRQRIYADHKAKGLLDFLVSWPDFQDAGGSPAGFKAHCVEVIAAGLHPCVMLSAKPTSSTNARTVEGALANIMLVLPSLVGVVPRFCIGWELSLWLSPSDVQFLIDQLSPIWLAQKGTLGYVHFQEGYFAFQQPGHDTADFWWVNRGKLHGILHQRSFGDCPDFASYQARLVDCLERFAGGFNFPSDNGLNGDPFDLIALEITAMAAFNNNLSEAKQGQWAQAAITTPPSGIVRVMGCGNGL